MKLIKSRSLDLT